MMAQPFQYENEEEMAVWQFFSPAGFLMTYKPRPYVENERECLKHRQTITNYLPSKQVGLCPQCIFEVTKDPTRIESLSGAKSNCSNKIQEILQQLGDIMRSQNLGSTDAQNYHQELLRKCKSEREKVLRAVNDHFDNLEKQLWLVEGLEQKKSNVSEEYYEINRRLHILDLELKKQQNLIQTLNYIYQIDKNKILQYFKSKINSEETHQYEIATDQMAFQDLTYNIQQYASVRVVGSTDTRRITFQKKPNLIEITNQNQFVLDNENSPQIFQQTSPSFRVPQTLHQQYSASSQNLTIKIQAPNPTTKLSAYFSHQTRKKHESIISQNSNSADMIFQQSSHLLAPNNNGSQNRQGSISQVYQSNMSTDEYFDMDPDQKILLYRDGQTLHILQFEQNNETKWLQIQIAEHILEGCFGFITKQGKILFVGGKNEQGIPSNQMMLVTIKHKEPFYKAQIIKRQLAVARYNHSAIQVGSEIYVVGGLNSKHALETSCESFDGTRHSLLNVQNSAIKTRQFQNCYFPGEFPSLISFRQFWILKTISGSERAIEILNNNTRLWIKVQMNITSLNFLKGCGLKYSDNQDQSGNEDKFIVFGGVDSFGQNSDVIYQMILKRDKPNQKNEEQFKDVCIIQTNKKLPSKVNFSKVQTIMIDKKMYYKSEVENSYYCLSDNACLRIVDD